MATNTYVALDTKTLTNSTTSSVNFTSVPQGYTDLIIVCSARTTRADYDDAMKLQFNSDTATNYSYTWINGDGTSAGSSRGSNQSYILTRVVANSAPSGSFNPIIFQIQNYANATTYKTALARWNEPPSGGTDYGVGAVVGLWRSTSAITNILLSPVVAPYFVSGSTFTLYGVAAASAPTPKATGGTITYDVSYTYHTFTSSGTFTPTVPLTADILVVAGGGAGGGGNNGGGGATGGGGAGGLLGFASQSLSSGTGYTCTVGAGGSGAYATRGSNGSDSQFNSLTTSIGGGGGGTNTTTKNGSSGGSGGGGGRGGGTGGSGTSGQGYAGGSNVSSETGGGGGGASGAGGNAISSGVGGNGGAASNAYSSWATVTGVGVSGYIAGGGGGGTDGSTAGTATGGGGAGTSSQSAGTAGTGNSGGGGGGGNGGANYTGAAGGSGLIIVRYAN